jgi:hypothetical protein
MAAPPAGPGTGGRFLPRDSALDDRRHVLLLHETIECGDSRRQHGLEPVEFHLQGGGQLLEHAPRLLGRPGIRGQTMLVNAASLLFSRMG